MYGYGFMSSFRPASTVSMDPDAQAFITAASITDPTQQAAVNQLVVDLKGYSLWTKMKAVYPMVGSSSSQMKWNLKDPRDLDVAFRLSFQGGWSFSNLGANPNGVNAYADTFFIPYNELTPFSNSFGYYSGSNITEAPGTPANMGTFQDVTNAFLLAKDDAVLATRNGGDPPVTYSYNGTRGFFATSRHSEGVTDIYINGSQAATGYSAGLLPPHSCLLGNIRIAGGVVYTLGWTKNDFRFAYFAGSDLSDTEIGNLYTAVQTFQTTLGRSIGTQTVSDSDAQAFVTAASITDQVEAEAVNQLVIDLKAASLWTKMKAVYPFIGSSASSCSYNLRNTAQYQITWYGGVSINANGVTGNGLNAYGDTGLNDNSVLSLDSAHISSYSRTDKDALECDMGVGGGGIEANIFPKYTGKFYPRMHSPSNAGVTNAGTSQGLFIANRVGSTETRNMQSGSVKVITETSVGKQNLNYFILAANFGSITYPTTRQIAFASIGDGLTDQNMTDLTTAVQTFQTSLSRNV